MKKKELNETLKSISESIKNECISYGEIAFIKDHKKEVFDYGDFDMIQWAMEKDEYNKFVEKAKRYIND